MDQKFGEFRESMKVVEVNLKIMFVTCVLHKIITYWYQNMIPKITLRLMGS